MAASSSKIPVPTIPIGMKSIITGLVIMLSENDIDLKNAFTSQQQTPMITEEIQVVIDTGCNQSLALPDIICDKIQDIFMVNNNKIVCFFADPFLRKQFGLFNVSPHKTTANIPHALLGLHCMHTLSIVIDCRDLKIYPKGVRPASPQSQFIFFYCIFTHSRTSSTVKPRHETPASKIVLCVIPSKYAGQIKPV